MFAGKLGRCLKECLGQRPPLQQAPGAVDSTSRIAYECAVRGGPLLDRMGESRGPIHATACHEEHEVSPLSVKEPAATDDSLGSAGAANTVAMPAMRNIETYTDFQAGARQNLGEISSSDRKAADDEMCEGSFHI
ncbi:unnamed protein product [Gongylonema pulchrum]|uniref:Uncharacterized protein n=1 Tax=Gongylonema pulchrum TaxID=637853 RepID=A0A183E6L2_9BILA|nr:unnamed protein product [Gongylonema pulchrum]